LEFGEGAADFGGLAGGHEAVFEDHAEVDGALDDGKEFCGAGCGYAQVCQDGESIDVLVLGLVSRS
jgi:hypothetical protein